MALNSNPRIYMREVTKFNLEQHRYIEVKYKGSNLSKMAFYMVEEPTDETYLIEEQLIGDEKWHTVIFDLWKNAEIKKLEEITSWCFDWEQSTQGAAMQIDYIRVI